MYIHFLICTSSCQEASIDPLRMMAMVKNLLFFPLIPVLLRSGVELDAGFDKFTPQVEPLEQFVRYISVIRLEINQGPHVIALVAEIGRISSSLVEMRGDDPTCCGSEVLLVPVEKA